MYESNPIDKSDWVTCSPMNLLGCDIYANRDAGLVAQGFRDNGSTCTSILLGSSRDNDLPSVKRVSREEMENHKWWAGISRRGAVFYNSLKLIQSPVLYAAKAAGLPIALNVDNSGIFDFHSEPRDFWRKSIMHKSDLATTKRLMSATAGVMKSYHQRINGGYRRCAAHLAIADVIGAVTPSAVVRFRNFLADYGQTEAADRVYLIPHPVHQRFILNGEKSNDGIITFVTVGRWDVRRQKRPDLLMSVIERLLASDPRFNFRVFGKLIPEMERWHSMLQPSARNRVVLHGIVPNSELLEAYQSAHIYLSVSAYESFLIAAAEAMCCGCSIVACNSPTLPGPQWFAAESRGTLSRMFDTNSLVNASLLEAEAWRKGRRNSSEMAAWAQGQTHANHVAESYATLLAGH